LCKLLPIFQQGSLSELIVSLRQWELSIMPTKYRLELEINILQGWSLWGKRSKVFLTMFLGGEQFP
jgi:hypothetical protein